MVGKQKYNHKAKEENFKKGESEVERDTTEGTKKEKVQKQRKVEKESKKIEIEREGQKK